MTDARTPSPAKYAATFVALLALLAITVGVSFLDIGHRWALTVALGIAAAKAVLIVLNFMHVRAASARVAMFAVAGFVFLGLFAALTMADYVTRGDPLTPSAAARSPPRSAAR